MTDTDPGPLNSIARPLLELMAEAGTTELVRNGPDTMFLEVNGYWQRIARDVSAVFGPKYVRAFCSAVNAYNSGSLSFNTPFLSGYLPDPGRERIQIVTPPAVEATAFSIRRPSAVPFTLEDYLKTGVFGAIMETSDSRAGPSAVAEPGGCSPSGAMRIIRDAVLGRLNIVISGGTGAGKTTFLNSLASLVPDHERLITIEDTREIRLAQPNVLHLTTQRESDSYGFTELLQASLRLRPDRIFAAELRGAEAFTYLRAVNTGHPGSITTLHASSCLTARHQLILMLSQARTGLPLDTLDMMIGNSVDVIIQISRFGAARRITGLLYRGRYINTKG